MSYRNVSIVVVTDKGLSAYCDLSTIDGFIIDAAEKIHQSPWKSIKFSEKIYHLEKKMDQDGSLFYQFGFIS